jgi:hypothetical protein
MMDSKQISTRALFQQTKILARQLTELRELRRQVQEAEARSRARPPGGCSDNYQALALRTSVPNPEIVEPPARF